MKRRVACEGGLPYQRYWASLISEGRPGHHVRHKDGPGFPSSLFQYLRGFTTLFWVGALVRQPLKRLPSSIWVKIVPFQGIHLLDTLQGLGTALMPRQAENASALSIRIILG